MMARALVTCAEELESDADASRPGGAAESEGEAIFRQALRGGAGVV